MLALAKYIFEYGVKNAAYKMKIFSSDRSVNIVVPN